MIARVLELGIFRIPRRDSLLYDHSFGENVKSCGHSQAKFIVKAVDLFF